MLKFDNVSFQYDVEDFSIIDHLSFDVQDGEFVSVIGASGCGKSTLAGCINGLNPFSNPGECSGELIVDGVDAPKSSIFQLSAHVGTVLQDPDGQFIGLTVGEDIAFALENSCMPQDEMHEITRHAAELVGIQDHLDYAPHELSGGQKQRLCIARAILKKPKILILDDSTSAVDTATDAAIRRAFAEDIPDTTKIIIAQRISSVQHADQIIVLDGGRVSDVGTHDELVARSGIYREVYESQTKGGGDDE